MDDLDDARTRSEGRAEAAGRGTSNANRNRFWAGLNRSVTAEADHHSKTAEKGQEEAPRGGRDASPRTGQ